MRTRLIHSRFQGSRLPVMLLLLFGLAAPCTAQSIDWREWGKETFDQAARQDRLVLLNLTSAWGRWCKAMEQETYGDPAVAEVVNASFVAVWVDRIERPDISDRYKLEGWPTTAVLTAQGEVLESASYLPPDAMIAFLDLVNAAYREERKAIDELLDFVIKERQALVAEELVRAPTAELGPHIVRDVAAIIAVNHDDTHGGFPNDRGSKYVHTEILDALMMFHSGDGDAEAERMLRTSLDAMATGGIRDFVNGGFFRYAVDARWRQPRFEKTLMDNAGILRVYAVAYRAFNNPDYLRVARECIDYLDNVLWDEQAGLYRMAQDSVAVGDLDDTYHTWTWDELEGIMTKDEFAAFRWAFEVTQGGDLRGPDGITRIGRNVLYQARRTPMLAEDLGITQDQARALVDSALGKMAQHRATLPLPPVDDRCDTVSNAFLVEAYLDAAVALQRPELAERALAVLDRLLEVAYDPRQGVSYIIDDGQARVDHLAIDNAALAWALLRAFGHTGHVAYLDHAKALAELIQRRFLAPGGMICDIAEDGPRQALLSVRLPNPRATAMTARVLLDLAAFTGESAYRDQARPLLQSGVEAYLDLGHFGATYGLAVRRYFLPPVRVVVMGAADDKRAEQLRQAALEGCLIAPHGLVARVVTPDNDNLLQGLGAKASRGAAATVCDPDCGGELTDPDDLRDAIRAAAGPFKKRM